MDRGAHRRSAIGAGLMTMASGQAIDGLSGLAATVSRVALTVFPIFFITWEATLGIGTGLMVDQAKSTGSRRSRADGRRDTGLLR